MKQLPDSRNTRFDQFSYRFAAAVLVALTLAPLARSAPVVDQQHIPDTNAGALMTNGNVNAQTFTVGRNGVLTQVDLQLGRQADSIGSLFMEIWPTTATGAPVVSTVAGGWVPGTPDLPPVATVVIDVSALPVSVPRPDLPFTSFDVRGWDLDVTAGDVFAIVLRSTIQVSDPYTYWNVGSPDYGGGSYYFSRSSGPWELLGHQEFSFRTWVVPEPTGAMLLLMAVVGFAVDGRQRSRPAA